MCGVELEFDVGENESEFGLGVDFKKVSFRVVEGVPSVDAGVFVEKEVEGVE